MVIIGSAGNLVIPSGSLVPKGGGSGIPITSFSGSFVVGSIPTCRVGIPIEFIGDIPDDATTKLYQVKVGSAGKEYAIFTGYISGRAGRITGRSIEAGVSLVHPARDMDTMRLLAPGMHSHGKMDYSYTTKPSGDGSKPGRVNNWYFKPGGGLLPKQIIDGIIKTLTYRNTITTSNKNGLGGSSKTINYARTIALLKSIKCLNGTLINIPGRIAHSINIAVNNEVEGSFRTQSSLWNSIVNTLGQFGLYVICDHNGDTLVSADLTNFEPPAKNFFYSNQIYSMDQSSSFGRNIKEVRLLNQDHRSPETTSLLATYSYPDPPTDPDGGTVVINLPPWLSPLNDSGLTRPGAGPPEPSSPTNPSPKPSGSASMPSDATEISAIYKAFAKATYNNERDKWKSMTFSGPLLPNVTPGTTVWVQPYSGAIALSKKEIRDGSLFSGYVSSVMHRIDVGSKSMSTTLTLRNVSNVTSNLNITSHPLFSDAKAFVLD